MKNAREYAEVRILDRPKKRLDAMIDLRTEILQKADSFYDQVRELTDRVMSEVHDPETDEGLLEVGAESYMGVLNVNLVELDKLLV